MRDHFRLLPSAHRRGPGRHRGRRTQDVSRSRLRKARSRAPWAPKPATPTTPGTYRPSRCTDPILRGQRRCDCRLSRRRLWLPRHRPRGERCGRVGPFAGADRIRPGSTGSPRYKHPRMLEDAQRAIRTVRARAAEWNLDSKRVAIIGFSAGGHLASTAATHFDGGSPTPATRSIEQQSSRPTWPSGLSRSSPLEHRLAIPAP